MMATMRDRLKMHGKNFPIEVKILCQGTDSGMKTRSAPMHQIAEIKVQ